MTDKPKLYIPCEACEGTGMGPIIEAPWRTSGIQTTACPNCTRGFVPVDAVDVWAVTDGLGDVYGYSDRQTIEHDMKNVEHNPIQRASLVLHEEKSE